MKRGGKLNKKIEENFMINQNRVAEFLTDIFDLMKIPQLKKKPELKSCHNTTWEDNYSWIHQDNILEVLKDSSKLLPDAVSYTHLTLPTKA